LIFPATDRKLIKSRGFLPDHPSGWIKYTLANTNVFNPKYSNWTTEVSSVLAGKSISELDIILNASVAGSGSLFNENVDNVVLTPDAVPEPSSLTIVAVAVMGASFIRLRKRRRLRG
jgi:hypothetical protein